MPAYQPKKHWRLAGRNTTQCGLPASDYNIRAGLLVVDSCVDATCKSCLRVNPGSVTKERAWHKRVPKSRDTLCGMRSGTWWRAEDLLVTGKPAEVTCKLCRRIMNAARRRKRQEAA